MRINFSFIIGIILVIIFGYLAFKILQWFYIIGFVLAPLLFLIAWIINKSVVLGYLRSIQKAFIQSFFIGLQNIIIKLIFLPFGAFGLLMKSYLLKIGSTRSEQFFKNFSNSDFASKNPNEKDSFSEYEELK